MAKELIDDFPGNLLYCVCKIEMTDINGAIHHSTGVWYKTTINNMEVLGVLTSKHSLQNYSSAVFKLCRANPITGKPIDNSAYEIHLSFENLDKVVIKDSVEDICFVILQINNTPMIKLVHQPFFISLTDDYFLDIDISDDFMLLQDVVMIGYPQGIYDDVNNKPVLRKGITSTPIKLDFKGKPEFLIDISCHKGSSGSPVFIVDKGTYIQGNAILPGPRLLFLGIFVGGWEEVTDSGTIMDASIENEQKKIRVKFPNNLGFVVKNTCIKSLKLNINEFLTNAK